MDIVNIDKIKNLILDVRDQKVILDSDVAELYGVVTKRINEAVKNNPEKFPEGYILELSKNEWDSLKTKFSTSIKGGKIKLPKAFTEKGLYMLATILKSEIATKTTLAIIETFAKIKELSRNVNELPNVKDKVKKDAVLKRSGELIAELLEDDMKVTDTETFIEVNFAVLKFRHTIKKKKN